MVFIFIRDGKEEKIEQEIKSKYTENATWREFQQLIRKCALY